MTPYHVSTKLPSPNQWVLARYTGGSWSHSGAINPGGQNWKVVLFIRGMSRAERAELPDRDSRRLILQLGDEGMSNERPFCWDELGPGCLFGQDVDYWVELPTIPGTKADPE